MNNSDRMIHDYLEEEGVRADMEEREQHRTREGLDVADFMKGLLIGVGAVLAVGALIALFTTRRRSHREGMRPEKRVESYVSGETLGDIPSEIEDNDGGVIDTIRAVNKALETGRQAMETLQDVMQNIRGNS